MSIDAMVLKYGSEQVLSFSKDIPVLCDLAKGACSIAERIGGDEKCASEIFVKLFKLARGVK